MAGAQIHILTRTPKREAGIRTHQFNLKLGLWSGEPSFSEMKIYLFAPWACGQLFHGEPQIKSYCGWTKSISHHLRTPE